MATQRILLGDCLNVLAGERNVPAIVADPPGLVGYSGFMGRKWDTAHESYGTFAPMLPPRDKKHARELEHDYNFSKYWAIRYAMAYDIADQHATMILWTLPRTSHLTANAVRAAGWTIQDNLVHLFGTGWAKTGNALAPGQEGWLLATKGKPDLDIDACRVPRGAGDVTLKPNKFSPNQHAGWSRPWNDDADAVEAANERSRQSQAKTQALGSLPKNALLSHCEECARVGVKSVKGAGDPDRFVGVKKSRNTYAQDSYTRNMTGVRTADFTNGTGLESVPAWHCLAGCVCGARSKWDPEKPLPRCPCGETWRWWCAVAEVNGQSGNRPSGGSNGVRSASPNLSLNGGNTARITTDGRTPDQGGSARFFNTFSYLSKCSSSERHAGCENLFWRENKKNAFGFDQVTREEYEANLVLVERKTREKVERVQVPGEGYAWGNTHATVKSYELMHWHHSLTGASKIVDLCSGSGSGMITAALDGIEWIGAEMCREAVTIAQARHAFWSGLSHEARRAMIDEGIVPQAIETHERQQSLF